MNNVISINRDLQWETKISHFRFNKRKFKLGKVGEKGEFMFITLEDHSGYILKVTGYSKYFIDELLNKRMETLDSHAKVIVSFLNYVFFDNYKKYKIKKIGQVDIQHGNDFLRDCVNGKIGFEKKGRETIERIESTLNRFYWFLYQEDLLNDDLLKKFRYKERCLKKSKGKSAYNKLNMFTVLYPNEIPPNRIKYITNEMLGELLKICDVYYPQLKLAICLQAFGGLRKGEVCNVSMDKINYSLVNGSFRHFSIDLREKTQMRSDNVDVGNIKKRRVQPIHPAFLPLLTKIYNDHMNIIKKYNNPYGATFINRNNDAMTDESYEKKFIEIIEILISRLSNRRDFNSNSMLNILSSGRINTHVLRYYFTQFIASLESTGVTDIAVWRGDSSLDSALTYLSSNPNVDERIKKVQEEMFKLF